MIKKVSVHGGHSGTYCGHAVDKLEDIVKAYIREGFSWICLTEHMPTRNTALIAPEEQSAGFDVHSLEVRFSNYFIEARELQRQYSDEIEILVGFETEAYSGYQAEVAGLIQQFQPDMIVGSVHHLHDLLFDNKITDYQEAVRRSGGIDALYCDYFDRQLELIETFEPAVVGHFDLIRIHDSEYRTRFEVPEIRERAFRNLLRIKALGLILDINMRSLAKGAAEPYLTEPLMSFAIEQRIQMAPGDDSHGVASVGLHYDRGIEVFRARGGQCDWPKPAPGRHVCGGTNCFMSHKGT